MKPKLLGVVAALIGFAAVTPALAIPLSLVDEGSITYDPNTGLRWLDVTQSINLSHDYVASQFGPGGQFFGFRYATSAEVSLLFTDGGIPNPYGIGPQNSDSPAYLSLIGMLGATLTLAQTNGQGQYTYGITSTTGFLNADPAPGLAYVLAMLNISAIADNLCNCQYADAAQGLIFPTAHDQLIGSFLVATPLPAALPLFATGLGALGLLGWRRKRKQAA
jgi:hypothetical protein